MPDHDSNLRQHHQSLSTTARVACATACGSPDRGLAPIKLAPTIRTARRWPPRCPAGRFPYASGLRRRLQGPPAASSATCRSMSSSPGWPLTLDQQQNSVARDPRSLYQEGVRNTLASDRDIFCHPVSQHSLQREMTALALSGTTRRDAGQSRAPGSRHAPGLTAAAPTFLRISSAMRLVSLLANRTRVPLRALPQK